MKIIIPFLLMLCSLSTSDYKYNRKKVNQVLDEIALIGNSKNIIKTDAAINLLKQGEDVLDILSDFFTDTTKTNVYSDCTERKLNKGELAIILADAIEFMPYAKVTHIQNCLMTFCEDNPNLIEYYLNAIRRDDVKKFQKRYREWLTDPERDEDYRMNMKRN